VPDVPIVLLACPCCDPQAKRLLEDVARQVQPLLRKRMWSVPLLSEFFPRNPNLLVRRHAASEERGLVVSACLSSCLFICPCDGCLSICLRRVHGSQGLNVGGGGGGTMEIKIRLRRAHRENDFYPWEHILGTMLHEITHNVRGPHDRVFYKILDELKEVSGLRSSQIVPVLLLLSPCS
jgi:DNA-dependent metalloprotease WSS1